MTELAANGEILQDALMQAGQARELIEAGDAGRVARAQIYSEAAVSLDAIIASLGKAYESAVQATGQFEQSGHMMRSAFSTLIELRSNNMTIEEAQDHIMEAGRIVM